MFIPSFISGRRKTSYKLRVLAWVLDWVLLFLDVDPSNRTCYSKGTPSCGYFLRVAQLLLCHSYVFWKIHFALFNNILKLTGTWMFGFKTFTHEFARCSGLWCPCFWSGVTIFFWFSLGSRRLCQQHIDILPDCFGSIALVDKYFPLASQWPQNLNLLLKQMDSFLGRWRVRFCDNADAES